MLVSNLGARDAKLRIDSSNLLYDSSSNNRDVLCENNLSLIDHMAGPTDIRYVKGLHIQDIHHTGLTQVSIDPGPRQCDLDSHTDTFCSSANCLLIIMKAVLSWSPLTMTNMN